MTAALTSTPVPAAQPTLGELVRDARRRLDTTALSSSPREAALMAARLLELSEAQVLAHPELAVPAAVADRFEQLLRRRLAGEPFAYLFGEREFYGRCFSVDRRVLIPRPETEHLVSAALTLLPPRPRILELGTGSGCIALTLALERPQAEVVATDLSLAALAVAAANRRRYQLEQRVQLVAADLCTAVKLARFDLVLSNPPYVDCQEAVSLSREILDHEPHLALFARGSGDAALLAIVDQAVALRPQTPLLLEIGQGQLAGLAAHAATRFEPIAVHHDYAGTPRVVVLRRRRLPLPI